MFGPVVGGLAVLIGRAGVFAGVAGAAMLCATWGVRFRAAARDPRTSFGQVSKAHGSLVILAPLWLFILPCIGIGALITLAPFELDRSGWGAVGIAATFLAAAAAGVFARPAVGAWADRRGLVWSIAVLLLSVAPAMALNPFLSSPWLLSMCLVVTICATGVLFGPTTALLSDAYSTAGVGRLFSFALVSFAGGVGTFLGSGVAGEVARAAGDRIAFGGIALLCFLTALAIRLRGYRSIHPTVSSAADA